MKKILSFLFILSLFFSKIVIAQSGWFWQNPLPQGNDLKAIVFIDDNTGFAAGNLGTVIKTTNGGQNWMIAHFSNTNALNSIYVINTSSILACGDSGTIIKSTNIGSSWQIIQSGTNLHLNKLTFINNVGYIAGNSGILLKSTDLGNTWFQILSGTTYDLYTIVYKNSMTGYLSGAGIYRITTDGGNIWTTYALSSGVNFRDLIFLNDNTGFAAGNYQHFPSPNGVSYKTTNGGYNWQLSGSFSNRDCYSVSFRDVNTGFIAASYGIFKTTDFGVSWIRCYSNDISGLYSVNITANNIYCSGWGGKVVKSNNNGVSWQNQTNSFSGFNNSKVFFCNNNVGYICGNEPGDSTILKTTNGGQIWLEIPGPAHNFFFSNYFININTGYLVNGTSIVYKTMNGGINWLTQQSNSSSGFRSVIFINQNTGFAGGYNSTIYKTTNGGMNWIFKHSGPSGIIYSLSFPSELIGYAVEAGYGAIKTTNGGENWYDLAYISGYSPCIDFINNNTGFVIAGHNILKSTNGGISWQNKFTSLLYGINDIKVLQSGLGYAICDKGRIIKTSNFGDNWNYQYSITDNSLYSVCPLNDSICYIVGDNKTILVTTNGGGPPLSIQQIGKDLPQSFSLSQNYPNPFNPVTLIKYDIPPTSLSFGEGPRVRLIIYDVLGREIETLVNQSQKPGSYEITWDGSRYASGVYFYKLMTDEWTETKKMVLIK